MLYNITRASDWSNEEQPCSKAYRLKNVWFIEISTLEELQALVSECGKLIVRETMITIYDDYVE